jgi:hypothetical protein
MERCLNTRSSPIFACTCISFLLSLNSLMFYEIRVFLCLWIPSAISVQYVIRWNRRYINETVYLHYVPPLRNCERQCDAKTDILCVLLSDGIEKEVEIWPRISKPFQLFRFSFKVTSFCHYNSTITYISSAEKQHIITYN